MANIQAGYASLAYLSPENPPVVYIEVPSKAVADIAELKPGNEVHILLVGKLLSKTERKAYNGGPGFMGDIQVEMRRIAIARNEDSMTDLLDE